MIVQIQFNMSGHHKGFSTSDLSESIKLPQTQRCHHSDIFLLLADVSMCICPDGAQELTYSWCI